VFFGLFGMGCSSLGCNAMTIKLRSGFIPACLSEWRFVECP
jgi:hypothetical protein